jgi:Tfp pilus assembly protein PilX
MNRQPHRLSTPVRGEDGYAMVVTVTVITILTLLLVVVLAQALHNNTATTGGARRSRALGVAEAGVSWAIAALDADPAAAVVTNHAVPVADGSGGTGTATVTVRKGTPTNPSRLGHYTIFSTGQVAQTSSSTRTLRVVIGPAASFTYALYADSSLTLEQNACIVGGVYAQGDVFFKNNTTIAGTSKARGSLISAHGVVREFSGANNPKCPATVEGEAVDTSNDIHGDVLAGGGTLSPCVTAPAGAVNAAAQGFNLGGATVGGRACNDPPPYTMPEYTFDPDLYANVAYFGQPPLIGAPSAAAVTTANAALAAANTLGGLDRTYVIWQDLTAFQATGTTPPALRLDTGTLRIASDTVIYTNVPVDFGNTSSIEAAQACSIQDPPPTGTPACPTFQVISAYPGSPCTGGVGNCPSIFGGNKIQFRPELAVLLYSREGTIELRNDCNSDACNDINHGAFYANTVDAKNNLNLNYTPRIANALGFGRTQLQQVSWQELAPCPAGQTPPC